MTQVLLECSKSGELQSCTATGHAGFAKKGSDIVCAAVSSLMRTTIGVLEKNPDIVLDADVSLRGTLVFRVRLVESACVQTAQKLIFAADFLQIGIEQIVHDYPENITLRVKNN